MKEGLRSCQYSGWGEGKCLPFEPCEYFVFRAVTEQEHLEVLSQTMLMVWQAHVDVRVDTPQVQETLLWLRKTNVLVTGCHRHLSHCLVSICCQSCPIPADLSLLLSQKCFRLISLFLIKQ